MGIYTATTRRWLERRYQARTPEGLYLAHQPIYGLGHPAAEPNHLPRLARVFQILKLLSTIRFGSFLDVGGSEGFVAWLVARHFGVPSISCDLAIGACRLAQALFRVPSAAVDCSRLPFADRAFDVVLCSEVIEHVEHPIETLLELLRVARVAVLLTTEELHHDRAVIERSLFRRPGYPHMERNLLHPDDLIAVFGKSAALRGQCREPPPEEPLPLAVASAWLLAATRDVQPGPTARGVVLCQALVPEAILAARRPEGDLLDQLLASVIPAVPVVYPAPADLDPDLLARLRCPLTQTLLVCEGEQLRSAASHAYPITDGIPDLFPTGAPEPTRAELEARLGARFPHERQRRAQILALRDALALPDQTRTSAWEFRHPEHRRGWWPNEQLTERPGDSRAFRWHVTGDDPWILSPCLARPIAAVELTLRVHNPAFGVHAPLGQLFWMGADHDGFSEDRHVDFPVRNDGEIHTVHVALAGHPQLPPQVYWLRLDPVNGPCELDLYAVTLR